MRYRSSVSTIGAFSSQPSQLQPSWRPFADYQGYDTQGILTRHFWQRDIASSKHEQFFIVTAARKFHCASPAMLGNSFLAHVMIVSMFSSDGPSSDVFCPPLI